MPAPHEKEEKEAGKMPAPQRAEHHITLAAEKYALDNDSMSDVARVHAASLKRTANE